MMVGDAETLKATILPENASVKDVIWSSDATAIATVDATGKVTALAVGTATITATTVEGGFEATCDVTVIAPYINPTGITVTPKTLSLDKDADYQLDAVIKPVGANPTVTWTTNNANIATVDATGIVTGNAAGKVIITAKTVNGYSATCTVTVVVGKTAPAENDFADDIIVYPNPTTGLLTICDMRYATSDNPTSEIEIFDIMGRTVGATLAVAPNGTHQSEIGNRKSEIANRQSEIEIFDVFGRACNVLRVTCNENEINISHLPTGVYFLRITTKTGIVTKKIIKE